MIAEPGVAGQKGGEPLPQREMIPGELSPPFATSYTRKRSVACNQREFCYTVRNYTLEFCNGPG